MYNGNNSIKLLYFKTSLIIYIVINGKKITIARQTDEFLNSLLFIIAFKERKIERIKILFIFLIVFEKYHQRTIRDINLCNLSSDDPLP